MTTRITALVARSGAFWIGAYALSAAFITYFSMYAFRRPFTVATYEHIDGWTLAVDFKIAVVICQVLGYALSKFIGVKVVSEARPQLRAWMIVGFVATSWLSLVVFAVAPGNWKALAIFMNGLPLGMIWGLVFSYLEGRRTSEVLGAGLCVSFIVSSGVVKSVGRALIVDFGVPELWMPAATGLLFFPILALSVFFLAHTPAPDAQDRAERMERTPMGPAERKAFFQAHAPGLILLVAAYVVLTALRDFRDNFAVEIWEAVGFADQPEIFTMSEIPVAAVSLLLLGATVLIRSNRAAVLSYHWLIIAGAGLIAGATLAFQLGQLGPLAWMVAVGSGVYLGYVPYNCMLFDRMTAALRSPGNAAFMIYVADSSGYAGSVGLLLFRNFGALQVSWLNFFVGSCYAAAAVIALTSFLSFLYFRRGLFQKSHVEMVPATSGRSPGNSRSWLMTPKSFASVEGQTECPGRRSLVSAGDGHAR